MPFDPAANKRRRVDLARAHVADLTASMSCVECGEQPIKLKHPLDKPSTAGRSIREAVKGGYALETISKLVAECTPLCLNCNQKLVTGDVEIPVCPTCHRPLPGHEPVVKDRSTVQEVVESIRAEAEAAKKAEEEAAPPMTLAEIALAQKRAELARPAEERAAEYFEKIKADKPDFDADYWMQQSEQQIYDWLDTKRGMMHQTIYKWLMAVYEMRFGKVFEFSKAFKGL